MEVFYVLEVVIEVIENTTDGKLFLKCIIIINYENMKLCNCLT